MGIEVNQIPQEQPSIPPAANNSETVKTENIAEVTTEDTVSLFDDTTENPQSDSADITVFSQTVAEKYNLKSDEQIQKMLASIADNNNDDKLSLEDLKLQAEFDKEAQKMYDAMFGSLFGFGTDEEKFYSVLEKATGEELANIIQTYNNTYGSDFIEDVYGDFSEVKSEVMQSIASKLMDAVKDGNKTALDVVVLQLHGSLEKMLNINIQGTQFKGCKQGEFVGHLIAQSDDATLSLVAKEYDGQYGILALKSDTKKFDDIASNLDEKALVQQLSDIAYFKTDNEKTQSALEAFNQTSKIDESLEGTELAKEIRNAQSNDDVMDILIKNCNGNQDVAQKIFDYLIPVSDDNSNQNPYYEKNIKGLMDKLYTNNGSNYVLNPELLNQFSEYCEIKTVNENGEEVVDKLPQKQYYTNFNGDLCCLEYDYFEGNDTQEPYMTLSFNDGKGEPYKLYYRTEQNANGEIEYITSNALNGEVVRENEEDFNKRLTVLENYTTQYPEGNLTQDEIEEKYALLAEYDNIISGSLDAIINEFASEGIVDDIRNWFSETFNSGISNQDIINEVKSGVNTTQIMLEVENGNLDEADKLTQEEFNSRLQTSQNLQEVFDTIKNYYGDEETAVEILKQVYNDPKSTLGEFKKDENGKMTITRTEYDNTHRTGVLKTYSLKETDCTICNPFMIEKIKSLDIEGVQNHKPTEENIYRFLTNGGQYSEKNVQNYKTASESFTSYNTAIAQGSADLEKCNSFEDAFKAITGKNIGSDDISDNDIQLFNDCYKGYNKLNSEGAYIYTLSAQKNADGKIEFDYRQGIISEKEGFIEIPSIDPNYMKDISFASEGAVTQKQKEYFEKFYENNTQTINDYIEQYASWVENDPESQKYFAEKYGLTSEKEIAAYLKENEQARYDESCKFMQYCYTTAKQALYGESKLDNMTNQYRIEMAQYSSNLSHALMIGCMAASVIFPAAAPTLMMGARVSGYLDNGIDLLNMVTNSQSYSEDDYSDWAKSTAFEVATKAGYRYFSNLAGNISKSLLEKTIDNNIFNLADALKDNSFGQILFKGTSEALIETGICIPYTMLLKEVQGGEYNLKDELIENFIYDFLPYARGWQDVLIKGQDSNFQIYDGNGTYYKMDGSDNRIYVNEKGLPIAVAALVNGEYQNIKTYDYRENGDYIVSENGVSKLFTKTSNGTKIVDPNNPSRVYQDTQKQSDGTYTTKYYNDDGTIKSIQTTDSKGRLVSIEQSDTKIEYNKSGKPKVITSQTNDGKQVTVDLRERFNSTKGTVKIDGQDAYTYTVDKNGIMTIVDNDGNKISLKHSDFIEKVTEGQGIEYIKDSMTLFSNLSSVEQDKLDSTCAFASVINSALEKGNIAQAIMNNCQKNADGKWILTVGGDRLELNLDEKTNFLDEVYSAYKNLHGENMPGDYVNKVSQALLDGSSGVCARLNGENFETLREYSEDKNTVLTFNLDEGQKLTAVDESGKTIDISSGHAYSVVKINDNGDITLKDPQDPNRIITIKATDYENKAQIEGATFKDLGYSDGNTEAKIVGAKTWESAQTTISNMRQKTQEAIDNINENQKILIGTRELFATETEKALYLEKLNTISTKPINQDYATQLIMSDIMLPEALATLAKIDISDCTSQKEVFNRLVDSYIESPEIFKKIGIHTDYIDAYLSRSPDEVLKSGLIDGELMGGDKIVHEICSALESKMSSDKLFANSWKNYCLNSETYKQYAALVEVYDEELKHTLKSDYKMIENPSHLIFRILQRDSVFDTNIFENLDFGSMGPIDVTEIPTFVTNLSNITSKINSGEIKVNFDKSGLGFIDFMNGQLMICKDKYGRIKIQTYEYKFSSGQSWDYDAAYLPQASSW